MPWISSKFPPCHAVPFRSSSHSNSKTAPVRAVQCAYEDLLFFSFFETSVTARSAGEVSWDALKALQALYRWGAEEGSVLGGRLCLSLSTLLESFRTSV